MENESVNYRDIKHVKEIVGDAYAERFLEAGWQLLTILRKHDEDDYASYVFGWPSGAPPIYPEKPPRNFGHG